MPGVLHVGFYNYVTIDSVIALIDYRLAAAKKIIKSAKEEKPRSVMDITKGRKAQTLIVLTGDRYVISAIYRQKLAKRLAPVSELDSEEMLPAFPAPPSQPEEIILDATGETTKSKRQKAQEISSD